jgi:hypothetical protein
MTTVTFDAVGTEGKLSAAAMSGGTAYGASGHGSFSLGSGLTNAALVVGIISDTALTSFTSVNWIDSGSVSHPMTQLGSVGNNGTYGFLYLFGVYLGNSPTSGAGTVAAVWTAGGTKNLAVCAVSFQHVDQSAGLTAASPATGNSSSLALTVTSAAGDYVFGVFTLCDQTHYLGNAAPATVIFNDNTTQTGTAMNYVSASGNVSLTAGSYTSGTFTTPASAPWAVCGVNISPPSGGGGSRGLFEQAHLTGLGAGGSFFSDRL